MQLASNDDFLFAWKEDALPTQRFFLYKMWKGSVACWLQIRNVFGGAYTSVQKDGEND